MNAKEKQKSTLGSEWFIINNTVGEPHLSFSSICAFADMNHLTMNEFTPSLLPQVIIQIDYVYAANSNQNKAPISLQ